MWLSKYTTELRYIVDMGFDLGLKDYPIFDENYRANLNKKIIEHYSFREIGFETAEIFKRFLNRTMNEIMPYYNQLYKSELLQFNPLLTKKLVETYVKENTSNAMQEGNGTQNSASAGENTAKNIFSDTPQGLLSIGDVETNIYASSASIDNTTGTTENTSFSQTTANTNATANENLTRNMEGYDGDLSQLLKNFRSTFMNIDVLIIGELNSLFMGLW